MDIPVYQQALHASSGHNDVMITPVTAGLINQTYNVVDRQTGKKFILQQINSEVFSEPEIVQRNYIKIWEYFYYDQAPGIIPGTVAVPEPLPFSDGNLLFCDSRNKYWRMFDFIEKSVTVHEAENSTQVKKTAQTFGILTASFQGYDPGHLDFTIPGFHDVSLRYLQFKESLHTKLFDRLLHAASIIDALKSRERYVSFYEVITGAEEFEQRIMHHDAKISNILFDEETGHVICPVDFDTCMPGYFFSDLGDMIRSMAGSKDESSTSYDGISIRKDFYEAILEGYLEEMNKLLTVAEKKYIHCSGLLIIYMQALRFLADYLNGDKYYKTEYRGQNYDRAFNQLTLLQRLEEFLDEEYHFTL